MDYFIDTSSLLKRYILEEGSSKIQKVFSKASNIYVSPLTLIESYSALNFRKNLGDLNRNDYKNIVLQLESDFQDFQIVAYDMQLQLKVKNMAEKYSHKTLDNIQLASCLVCKIKKFISSDKKLIRLAKSEKLQVLQV